MSLRLVLGNGCISDFVVISGARYLEVVVIACIKYVEAAF